MKLKSWWLAAAVCVLPLLHACGGNADDEESFSGAARLVNATDGSVAFDLYADDNKITNAVAVDSAGGYTKLDEGSYAFKLKAAGSSTTSLSSTHSISDDLRNTLLAYTTGQTLKAAWLDDEEDEPSSGSAKLRVFNASTEAGTVDVYLTTANASLDDTAATTSALGGEKLSAYSELSSGSYRVRVVGSGDTTDLRLDIPAFTLTDQQIATLVLTSTPGGVLVHGLLVNERGAANAHKNTAARVRLVASVADKATVAATANGTGLMTTALVSPKVGVYKLVDAGALTLDLKVNGATVAANGRALVAGSDTTLLVTGTAANATLTQLDDDNRPAQVTGNTKLRLVHGVSGLDKTLSLTAAFGDVASDVALTNASTPRSISAGTAIRLAATATGVTDPLYLDTEVTLEAARVYTLFMLGDATTPVAELVRDR